MPMPFLARAAIGFANTRAIGRQAADLFSHWFPSLTIEATVKLQGQKTTPSKSVLHGALAMAFGMVDSLDISEVALDYKFDHTNNQIELGYAESSAAFLYMLNSIAAFGGALGEGIVDNMIPTAADV